MANIERDALALVHAVALASVGPAVEAMLSLYTASMGAFDLADEASSHTQ